MCGQDHRTFFAVVPYITSDLSRIFFWKTGSCVVPWYGWQCGSCSSECLLFGICVTATHGTHADVWRHVFTWTKHRVRKRWCDTLILRDKVVMLSYWNYKLLRLWSLFRFNLPISHFKTRTGLVQTGHCEIMHGCRSSRHAMKCNSAFY